MKRTESIDSLIFENSASKPKDDAGEYSAVSSRTGTYQNGCVHDTSALCLFTTSVVSMSV